MLVCASLHNFARETAGAARTRLSLRPLAHEGERQNAKPGRNAPRDCEGVGIRHCERAKQSSFLPCCAMDCFAALAMTIFRFVSWLFDILNQHECAEDACTTLSSSRRKPGPITTVVCRWQSRLTPGVKCGAAAPAMSADALTLGVPAFSRDDVDRVDARPHGVTGNPFGSAMPFSPATSRRRSGRSEMMPSTPMSIRRAMSSCLFTVQTTTLSPRPWAPQPAPA